MFWPCDTRTSTCRNLATISSGLYRFLAITVLLDVKDISQVGSLQWGRIKGATHVLRLSGTMAYLDWAMLGGAEPRAIGQQYVEAAVRLWRDYFWPHSRAALRQIGLTEKHTNARRALSWTRANQRTEVSIQDIRQDALGRRLDAEQTR